MKLKWFPFFLLSAVPVLFAAPAQAFEFATVSLEFNISGNSNDEVFVGTQGAGFYNATQAPQPGTCLGDASLAASPAFGIIATGRLRYVNVTSGNSYQMQVAQALRGNSFVIPVTTNGCGSVLNAFETIKARGYMPRPFVRFIETTMTAIEIALSYPGLDIAGDFAQSGLAHIALKHNETAYATQLLVTEI